ncbi:hypothetical protein [Streptomyces sp. NBC_01197]|uniref:hypothetical protein n=1 Tax=Streptomyces sp. NBC_01197 TaxID=2903768 RepID=UPI002E1035E0|nr:RNA recognition motif domain-containing protein [Streptomyces sp. NBC_01197]
MNYTEKYEVRKHEGFRYVALHQFDDETDAIEYMDLMAKGSGCWHVIRVMEVTVSSVIKA